MKITTIISYCTNDERFIRPCIDNALQVSDEIIIPVSSHWYDGTVEDMNAIEILAAEYPQVNITTFDWEPGKHPRYWNNMARAIGIHLASKTSDWLMFIDTDEIIDTTLFNKFKQEFPFNEYDSLKIGNYTYFREPIYRANTNEDSVVMVRKEYAIINPDNLSVEREQLHEMLNVRKRRMVLFNDTPLVHHFSWVRTKEQMVNKVSSWSHRDDKDWISCINEEFSRDFNGKDFIHGYSYETVENRYKI